MSLNASDDADVIIVGAGPVGLTLANLLGAYGVKTIVIERNTALEVEPRAVSLDDESLRTMQACGLLEQVTRELVLGYGVQYYDWRGKPFAAIQPVRQEYGFPKRNAFRQPALVRTLHEGLSRYPSVQICFGQELVSLRQDGHGVIATVALGTGTLANICGRYLVGCDGGRSDVRKTCNIALDGSSFPQRWLIVDLANRTTPYRHTRTYCDPRRPTIRLPGPAGTLRYEFMVKADERDEDVLNEQKFRRWIDERMPEDANLPLVRKAVYGFHARVAARWKHQRVLLAGDAAHLTPPFAGQGLNSGIRDASNLAWKLAAVCRRGAAEELLETYEQERRDHAIALIKMALHIGAFMQPATVLGAVASQFALRAACRIPRFRDYILQLKFKPKPVLRKGFFVSSILHPESALLPQPLLQGRDGSSVRLDDLLGNCFGIIGWHSEAFRTKANELSPAGMPTRIVGLIPADHDFLPGMHADGIVVRDAQGEMSALLEAHCAVALIVRPDRYTYQWLTAADLEAASGPSSAMQNTVPRSHHSLAIS